MKKLLSYIISTIIVVGLGVGIFFIVQNIRNSKEYKLTVASGDNGSIVVKIDDNRYTISSTTEESFTVTRKSDITLKAVPNPCYLFSKWDINGSANGTNAEIDVTIKKDATYKATFIAGEAEVTVVDESNNQIEKFNLNVSENLLNALNTKYAVPGYTLTYKINDQDVTADTRLTSNVTIVRTKTLNTYTVKFMHGETQVGSSQEFNIENFDTTEFSIPEVPVINHYSTSWKGVTNVAELKAKFDKKHPDNIVVELEQIPTEYNITYTLPENYTFANGENAVVITCTIVELENDSYKTKVPNLPTARTGYRIAWDNEVTKENLANLTINAVESIINYTVTFIDQYDNNKEYNKVEGETQTYNVENYDTITIKSSELPNYPHYTVKWKDFKLSKTEPKNYVVNLDRRAIEYVITYELTNDNYSLTGFEKENEGNPKKAITFTIENFDKQSPELPQALPGDTINWSHNLSTKENFEQFIADANIPNGTDLTKPVTISTNVLLVVEVANYEISIKDVEKVVSAYEYKAGSTTTLEDKAFQYKTNDTQEIVIDATPTRVGYNFAGFTISKNVNSEANPKGECSIAKTEDAETYTLTIPAKSYGNIELTAKWTAKTFTVAYNANGGTGEMTNSTFTYDAKENKLTKNTFTKVGYKFVGWAKEASGTKVYNDEANTLNELFAETTTLYAVWELETYKLTISAENGSVKVKNSQGTELTATEGKYDVTYGETYTLEATANEHYDFKEFAIDSKYATLNTNTNTITIKDAGENNTGITLTATFTIKTFKLVVDATNGNDQYKIIDTDEYAKSEIENAPYGETYTLQQGTPNGGYKFVKWVISATGYEDVDLTTNSFTVGDYGITGSTVTITAVFKEKTFKLSLLASNGSVIIKDGETTLTETEGKYNVTYGKTYTLVSTANNYYLFDKYSCNITDAVTFNGNNVTINNVGEENTDFTITAVFNGKTITVTYDSNGGTGSMANSTFTYGETNKLAKNLFAKENEAFCGWKFTYISGETKEIILTDETNTENTLFTSLTINNVTLYATWAKIHYIDLDNSTVPSEYNIYNNSDYTFNKIAYYNNEKVLLFANNSAPEQKTLDDVADMLLKNMHSEGSKLIYLTTITFSKDKDTSENENTSKDKDINVIELLDDYAEYVCVTDDIYSEMKERLTGAISTHLAHGKNLTTITLKYEVTLAPEA